MPGTGMGISFFRKIPVNSFFYWRDAEKFAEKPLATSSSLLELQNEEAKLLLLGVWLRAEDNAPRRRAISFGFVGGATP